MHDMSKHDAVAHHAPTSFISKHVFSLDHKVIGKQYYGLALLAALVGMVLSWLMRLHLGWTKLGDSGTAFAHQERCSRRRDDAGVLPAIDDHACHHHGLFCAHDGAVRGLRQLFLAHPGRRRGHALSPLQHDVVLGHVRGVPGSGVFVLRWQKDPPSAVGPSTLR